MTLSSSTATYGGKTVELTKDSAGDVTFVGGTNTDTLYRVNTADVTVGGTSATANTGRATAFIIAQERTVTIAGDSAAATASTILRDSSGEGNLVLSTDVTLQGGQQTQLGGKLTINDGVTHTVGAGSGDSSNISSFKGGVELAGGSLMINGAGQEVNSLTVSKASILGVANQYQSHQTYKKLTTSAPTLSPHNKRSHRKHGGFYFKKQISRFFQKKLAFHFALCYNDSSRRSGGIGRHAGLKIPW